ncbi:MAG: VPS10 domain-containing protein [Bacteroidia bacterium]
MNKIISLLAIALISFNVSAQKKKETTPSTTENSSKLNKSGTYSGLKFRNIGPAFTSGRIGDLAVNPNNPFEYYVAVASGGVWKTTNAGTTFTPIFDGEGSYSIGCISLAPNNENIVWVGTGENNNQRSVAYGDGVYKSEDGGKSWKNMGLKTSEHIGKIIVHPTNSDIVYVAAYGPLWSAGGERGVYKTMDGGKTWERILHISDNTGVSDILMDPRNPDVIYAAAHQRRRHVWTYIDGGPESAVYKTTNGGKSWDKLTNGLPSGEVGRIGLAIASSNPDVVYAIIIASHDKSGFFRSNDRGASWKKMSGHFTTGNYYQEIFCDPKDENKVFSMDTWLMHTEDGGKTFKRTGEKSKHVDNHAMWIDPNNTNHWIVGCDGGIYETFDHAENWHYKPNLPITQFYKVAVDNSEPFYFVYGGTQDNNSMGGPSRTTNAAGIVNSDWYITNGGDGFESQVDYVDPNIVYAQAQYGWLVRYDKKSGETVGIQPQPKKDEAAYRWNWDAPLLISPHNHKTLYFCANIVFKSDDRGNSWKAISPDLSRQIDRNKLPVMGRVWSIDAVQKNQSTSIYGNITAFDESPKQQGVLYVGTDDGLIQVSENDGGSWRKIETFVGVPNQTYVNMVLASQHDANVAYAAFNNHKNGDFKPYVLKTIDKGKTWTSITNNLPARGSVYSIAEDHVNPNLLFAGTEFGIFFTIDGGKTWTQLKAGLPTIAIKDIAIQKRENDLVLATFGRGFYILDDYSPLRTISEETLNKEAHIFPIKASWLFIENSPLGGRGKSDQGESYFTADNPPVGAVFTYYLKESIKTQKELRTEREAKLLKDGKDTPYPSIEELRAEDAEESPYLLFVIKDDAGTVVRKLKASAREGINRIDWDYRMFTTSPISLQRSTPDKYESYDNGPLALPGNYTVELFKSVNGEISPLVGATPFEVKALDNQTLVAQDKKAAMQFHQQVAELRRSVKGTAKLYTETSERLKHIKAAIEQYPTVPLDLMKEVKALENELQAISLQLHGDQTLSKREFETAPTLQDRIDWIVYTTWYTTAAPTESAKQYYQIAQQEYPVVLDKLKKVISSVKTLESKLDNYNSPYTPGRDENWKEE